MKYGFLKGRKVAECQDSQKQLMARFLKENVVDEWRDSETAVEDAKPEPENGGTQGSGDAAAPETPQGVPEEAAVQTGNETATEEAPETPPPSGEAAEQTKQADSETAVEDAKPETENGGTLEFENAETKAEKVKDGKAKQGKRHN
jgi:hypothetical protein